MARGYTWGEQLMFPSTRAITHVHVLRLCNREAFWSRQNVVENVMSRKIISMLFCRLQQNFYSDKTVSVYYKCNVPSEVVYAIVLLRTPLY